MLASFASVAIVSVVVGAGVLWLYNDNVRYQDNISHITQAHDAVESTDQLVLQIDEAVGDPLGDLAKDLLQREDEKEEALEAINQAERASSDAASGLREKAERAAADNLMTASSSRKTMVESGWALLQSAQDWETPYIQLNEAWQDVLEADDRARQAAFEASSGNRDVIGASSELANEALQGFDRSLEALEVVAQENSSLDIEDQLNYVRKRIEALEHAIASDKALQARDTQTAVEQNDAYNSADEEAALMAERLPADPGQPALDAMEADIADERESYEAARAQASASDAFLRDYFGSSER